MSLCSQNNGLEPACLKQRLDEAVARADQLEQKLEDLRARLEALSTLAGQLQSIGDPQEGKADDNDNLWRAIKDIRTRLKTLEKE
jgi:chromosome segregation ATPase